MTKSILISLAVVATALVVTIQGDAERPYPGDRPTLKGVDSCPMRPKPAKPAAPQPAPSPAKPAAPQPAPAPSKPAAPQPAPTPAKPAAPQPAPTPGKPAAPQPAPAPAKPAPAAPKGRRKRQNNPTQNQAEAAGECYTTDALEAEIQPFINALLKKRLDATTDPKENWENDRQGKCLFNETEIDSVELVIKGINGDKPIKLSYFVQVPEKLRDIMTLWSGVYPPFATKWVDDRAVRLENTKLGKYLNDRFPWDKEDAWPEGFTPSTCHFPRNWDHPDQGKWVDNKMIKMPLFRALWYYASKNFAMQLGKGEILQAYLSVSGGKGGMIGDTFKYAEYPQVKSKKITTIKITVIEDPSQTKEHPAKFNCTSPDLEAWKAIWKDELHNPKIECVGPIKLDLDAIYKTIPATTTTTPKPTPKH